MLKKATKRTKRAVRFSFTVRTGVHHRKKLWLKCLCHSERHETFCNNVPDLSRHFCKPLLFFSKVSISNPGLPIKRTWENVFRIFILLAKILSVYIKGSRFSIRQQRLQEYRLVSSVSWDAWHWSIWSHCRLCSSRWFIGLLNSTPWSTKGPEHRETRI